MRSPVLDVDEQVTAGAPLSSAPRLAPPYVIFDRAHWATLRGASQVALPEAELRALAGVNDPASLSDVTEVFLPLVRLIELHMAAARSLNQMVGGAFVGQWRGTMPYVIAIAGSVAVGKSTFARLLRAVLSQGPSRPRVDLVATDGFLHPTKFLKEHQLMERKGFPESYDLRRMLTFLEGVKAGDGHLQIPNYSHEAYDVVPGEFQVVNRPDILIFEGLNVLQTANSTAVASDFFDFTIYLDADTATIEDWYVDRFLKLQRTVFQREASYFHHYKDLTPEAAAKVAHDIWRRINLPNLVENIEPTRRRARVVMRKGRDHRIEEIWLRQT
ncbi:MAG TPA: type I pantothenate kinase [Gemmatimonas sp.]|uniref:type I pantothenate kinase n=1 Tax=Gemmatimonas sp. TaxID=1962908 RepID=UPI002ED97324